MHLPTSTASVLHRPAGSAIVRTLYWELVKLQEEVPYREARLRRIANQLEYVLQEWPALQWPASSTDGEPIPHPAFFLSQLSHLPSAPSAQQQLLLSIVRLLR